MANFDWQTEEDDAIWEEPKAERPSTPPPSRRRWWVVLALVLVAVVAGAVVYRQIRQQADTVLTAVETDILSTHDLVVSAAAERDADLLRALLSGRDMQWVRVQETLAIDGLLLDRAPLGMTLQADSQTVVDTEIAPDLESAELTYQQSFAVTDADGVTETVTLAGTAVYRRGSQRWLLAPPEDDFWGEWDTIASTRLMLVFPARDEPIARQLFPELDDLLIRICTQLADITCDEEMQLILRLEKDPETLADLAEPEATLDAGMRLSLPTPTLVGLPQDEAGFAALLRGYGAQMAAAVIAYQTGYRCCEHLVIFQTLLDYQLDQLGLRHWPVTMADHEALWEEELLVSLDDLIGIWRQQSPQALAEAERRQTYAAIDFLLYEFTDQTPAAMQRLLNQERLTFSGWLRQLAQANQQQQITSVTSLVSELDSRWRLYSLLLGSASMQTKPSIPPDEALYLVCAQDVQMLSTMHRYDFDAESWEMLQEANGLSLFFPLADDTAALQLLIQEQSAAPGMETVNSQILRWDGPTPQVLVDDGRYLIALGQVSPDGRYLAAYPLNFSEAETEGPTTLFLDLPTCDEDGCDEYEVPGVPMWSPDGQQALFTESFFFSSAIELPDGRYWLLDNDPEAASAPIYRAPTTSLPVTQNQALAIGVGYAPFWVDNERYGFVRLDNGRASSVMLSTVGETEPRTLVNELDLLAALPAEINRPLTFSISYVLPYPQDRTQLFVIGSGNRGQGYLFLVDSETGDVSYRLSLGYLSTHTLGFSPDGRYLTTTIIREESDIGMVATFLSLHDIAANETQEFLMGLSQNFPTFLYDWSLDGEWLAVILDQNLVQLIAPAQNYRELLPHRFGECASIHWMEGSGE